MASTGTHRDPDARRRAILEAAAQLIREGDLGSLTHRKVAARAEIPLGSTTYYFASLADLKAKALEVLATEIEDDLAVFEEELLAHGATAEVIAGQLHRYLNDDDRVRTETALYVAGFENSELAALGRRWFDGLVRVLAIHVGPDTATAMAVFTDGAALHAVLHEQPLPLALIEQTARNLMASGPAANPPQQLGNSR